MHIADIVPKSLSDFSFTGISGLVVEYIVAIDVTRVRFPADAFSTWFVLLHTGPLDLSSSDHGLPRVHSDGLWLVGHCTFDRDYFHKSLLQRKGAGIILGKAVPTPQQWI